jgi:hypothetical protein
MYKNLILIILLALLTACGQKPKQSNTARDSVFSVQADTLQKSIDTLAVQSPENKPDTAKVQATTPKQQTKNGKSIKLMPCKVQTKFVKSISNFETYLIDTLNETTMAYGTRIFINRKTNMAVLSKREGRWYFEYNICNFPKEIMNLEISEKGIFIKVSGKCFFSEKSNRPSRGEDFYYNLELTKIKFTNN